MAQGKRWPIKARYLPIYTYIVVFIGCFDEHCWLKKFFPQTHSDSVKTFCKLALLPELIHKIKFLKSFQLFFQSHVSAKV